MSDEPEVIRQQMCETRTALAEKLETLEQHVVGTVNDAQTAVTETVDNVKEAVHETVGAIKESVQESVDTVRQAFDLQRQVDSHPWLCVGSSVAFGYLCGRLMGQGPVYVSSPTPYKLAMAQGNGSRDHASMRETAPEPSRKSEFRTEKPSWLHAIADQFSSEIDKVKSLAIGVGVGVVRDMITQSAPPQIRQELCDVMNRVTSKLGGAPIREPLIAPNASEADMRGCP